MRLPQSVSVPARSAVAAASAAVGTSLWFR